MEKPEEIEETEETEKMKEAEETDEIEEMEEMKEMEKTEEKEDFFSSKKISHKKDLGLGLPRGRTAPGLVPTCRRPALHAVVSAVAPPGANHGRVPNR